MTTVIFHDFPGLENSFLKFHDFAGQDAWEGIYFRFIKYVLIYDKHCKTQSTIAKCHSKLTRKVGVVTWVA